MDSAIMHNRTKDPLNISDAAPRSGSMKPAAAVICGALILAVLSALLLIAARPAQAQETALYNFTGGSDGGDPQSSLTFDTAGNLYGTTYSGGLWGYGTVFELSPNGNGGWNETVLYNFTGEADGANPTYSYVMLDSAGNLYGTTYNGGANGLGVVFELSLVGTSWTETVLHSFAGGTDGANPVNGLVMDSAGNLYGKTYSGGSGNNGTVFELIQSGGGWTNQVIFASQDGANFAGLTMDSGNIYTTSFSQVYELLPNGSGGWNLHVFHDFSPSSENGYDAESAPLVQRGGAVIYGTTLYGGAKGHGTVYLLAEQFRGRYRGTWQFRIVYSFTGKDDGAGPFGGLVSDGYDLWGTTSGGGKNGDGTVFWLEQWTPLPSYKYFPVWSFNRTTGAGPFASLILDSAYNLYGTTAGGGPNGAGVVFKANAAPSPTYTSLTSSPNPSTYGQAVTFTALVSCIYCESRPPNGDTVTFIDGRTAFGAGTLSGDSASFTTSALKAGRASIKAVYGGDWGFVGSTSNTLKQVVSKATTTTALASSQNPSDAGQPVTFTASVTSQFSGTVTGTVIFYDGTTKLGSKPLKGGAAQFTTKKLTAGAHTITATYQGSSNFTGSSASLTQTVN
ncbi:MAG: choice-of-anchor tandem repeat GloVer-containing protein [Terriglobales bacterium]